MKPHTDQFEEIRKEFDEKFRIGEKSWHPNFEEISAWWLSKLHHIRRETEKGMMEKVKREWQKIYRLEYYDITVQTSEHDKFRDFLSSLESDTSTQK